MRPNPYFNRPERLQWSAAQNPPYAALTRGNAQASKGTNFFNAATAVPPTISDKYHGVLAINFPHTLNRSAEADDKLHNPDPLRDRRNDKGGNIFSGRGLMNLGCIFLIFAGIITLFAGYPLITYFNKGTMSFAGGFNYGGINSTGQIPDIPGNWGLIDRETPLNAWTKVDYVTGKTWHLVFSDEFNVDGRTFYPGDDPYWEAVDLHYWATSNKEWYDPAAITTRDGALEITLSRQENHGLEFTGGMLSSWNKFCFTGGLVEASVMLPGYNDIQGLWPAIWAMGNLGRAGYGASLDGLWPYSYDACDVGTVPNQTFNGLPLAATVDGDPAYDGVLSYLPGQRLSRCTCRGESHPGPMHDNGEYVGRAAPEIDMFEAQIGAAHLKGEVGSVSQSAQWAPFNHAYIWSNISDNLVISDIEKSGLNSYIGGVYQQATSVVTKTNQRAYEFNGGESSVYGFQYEPGFGDAYIAWISDGVLSWQLNVGGVVADSEVEISDRPIPREPMYLIMNLGISENFGFVDYENLPFPNKMRVDWIRVYQDPKNTNIGCDPPDFPTKAYIEEYIEAYTNPNLTTWVDDYQQVSPKNQFLGQC